MTSASTSHFVLLKQMAFVVACPSVIEIEENERSYPSAIAVVKKLPFGRVVLAVPNESVAIIWLNVWFSIETSAFLTGCPVSQSVTSWASVPVTGCFGLTVT